MPRQMVHYLVSPFMLREGGHKVGVLGVLRVPQEGPIFSMQHTIPAKNGERSPLPQLLTFTENNKAQITLGSESTPRFWRRNHPRCPLQREVFPPQQCITHSNPKCPCRRTHTHTYFSLPHPTHTHGLHHAYHTSAPESLLQHTLLPSTIEKGPT